MRVTPALGAVALALVVAPATQSPFQCRTTAPNGNVPSGTPTSFFGNGRLATVAYGVIGITDRTRNADLRNRFIAEGRIQAQMRHPNIVGVTEIVTSPVAGLVLEYVEGSTLDQYVAGKGRPLDASEIRRAL